MLNPKADTKKAVEMAKAGQWYVDPKLAAAQAAANEAYGKVAKAPEKKPNE